MQRLILYIMLLFAGNVFAQVSIKDSAIAFPLLKLSYSYQIPQADLAKRFGHNSNLSFNASFKLKSNWIFGAEGWFIFGNELKEQEIFNGLKNSQGAIIDQGGLAADIRAYERGYAVYGTIGKIFPYFSPNPNCGFMINLKGGFLQHKISIEDINNSTPQLSGDYVKGYDRLSNGFSASVFAGYMYLGNTRLINFFTGVEFVKTWAYNRRSLNFDTGLQETAVRNDALIGFRAGIVIPLHKKVPKEYYYY